MTKTTIKKTTPDLAENQELSSQPVGLIAKQTNPQRIPIWEPTQQTDRFPGIENLLDRIKLSNRTQTEMETKVSRLRPTFTPKTPWFYSSTALDTPETTYNRGCPALSPGNIRAAP